jgi:PKHD-type hydroxylase
MFLRVPNLLNEEQLATVRASLNSEQAPWVDGRVTAGHQGAPVKNNQQLDEASPMARELGNFILSQLERNALFISAVLPNKVYPPMINRYGEGMHFGTHVDGTVRMIPGSVQKLRTDLSATLFLSAQQAYDGGELVVESDFGSRSAKLAAGDMIVYSSTARHRERVLDSKPDSRRRTARPAVRARRYHPTPDAKRRGFRFAGTLDRALPRTFEGLDGDLIGTAAGDLCTSSG